MKYKEPYTQDNGDIAFGIEPEDKKSRKEYWRNYNAKRKERRRNNRKKMENVDLRRRHRHSSNDTEYKCPVHDHPLKRYESNKNRFRGYDNNGNPIYRGNIFYRCNHCLSEGLRSNYSEKHFKDCGSNVDKKVYPSLAYNKHVNDI